MPRQRYIATDQIPALTDSAPSEELLHARYWNRIRFFAARQLRDSALAEDVAQETLFRVFEALRQERVRDLATLPSFVFQTARNICLQHLRSSRRKTAAHQLLAGETSGQTTPDAALESLIAAERRVLVRNALAALEPRDRDLLHRVYVDGEDSATIAADLGIDPPALRVRKHRALGRIRAAVEKLAATFPSLREPPEEES